jgi:predicted aspartyl protease
MRDATTRQEGGRGPAGEGARGRARGRLRARAALLGAGLIGAAGASAEARPRYPDARRGVFLSFLNAPHPGGDIDRSPRLGLSFGGAIRPVLVDTGSTGIVVSAARIPDVETLPSRPGRLTYSSSGRIMIGRWVSVPVTLWGDDGAHVATRPIPVLAVDRIACTDRARRCRPEEAPAHVAMMGIGFGREDDSQAQSTPDTNPLLNAQPPGPGTVHRGYVLTRRGLQVGLTRADTRGRFRFVKLDPHPRVPGDWLGPPACITVDGREPGTCGRALLDTGVTGMFLTLPPGQVADRVRTDAAGHDALVPGTRLSFRFGDAAGYAITVGDRAAPLAPDRVTLDTTRPQPFVNTGLRVLNGFDLLYDADRGYFGLRARRPARAG